MKMCVSLRRSDQGGTRRREGRKEGRVSSSPGEFSFRTAEVTFSGFSFPGLWGLLPLCYFLWSAVRLCGRLLRLPLWLRMDFPFPQMFRSGLSKSFLRVAFNRLVSSQNNKTFELLRYLIVCLEVRDAHIPQMDGLTQPLADVIS